MTQNIQEQQDVQEQHEMSTPVVDETERAADEETAVVPAVTAEVAPTDGTSAIEPRAEAEPPAVAAPSEAAGQFGEAVPVAPRADEGAGESEETFADLGLSAPILRALKDLGYEAPTPIQSATIPLLLAGRDVIAQAQTGSGKTAAFGLPIIENIDAKDRTIQALILTPTRELAIQVAEALHKYGRYKGVETLPIYGGQAYERQFRGLQRGVQIVVGTPGRVMDHMRRGTLSLENIRYFILDEADEMLDMGFIDDVDWILGQVPGERQMALFSATMPPRIVQLARAHMRNLEQITVRGREITVPTTVQSAYEVPRARKVDALTRILDAESPTSAMIFCRTKTGVDELGEALLARGYAVETLHGDLSQAQRDRVMRRFRTNQADILIATDVAARGLDIPEVSHVINYDIPESPEAYVHRIGRTGRAGRAGEAITLITPRETRWLRQIERITKAKIELRRLPTLADVAERRREVLRDLVAETLKDEDAYAPYLTVVEELSEEHEMASIAAAALKLYADETGRAAPTDQKEDDLATFTAAQRGRGESGMVRLFLSVGRIDGIRPQDIVGAIANEAGIPGRSIGAIDILDSYTFVDVPAESADTVIEALERTRIKGRPVHAEISTERARPGRERAERGPRVERPFRERGPRSFERGPRRESERDDTYRGGRQGARGTTFERPSQPRAPRPYRPFQRDETTF